jgi:pimeloyl-ACP methyl ester carboxylesterase
LSQGTANVPGDGAPTTFALIPGAGTHPEAYGATIAALRELGHEGIAPPLPLADPTAGPSDHADAIAAALPDPPPDPLVIVGQSLGAYAATIAADRLRPARLILVSPMIPAPGESAGEWWEATGHGAAIAPQVERYGPPSEWSEEALVGVFLHDADPEARAASAAHQGPAGDGMFSEPLPLDAWPDVPTTVLAPREDRFFPLDFQRRVARERLGVEVVEMGGGHVPFVSRPRELAERLVELAGTASQN